MPSADTPLSLAPEDWERLDRYFGGELPADEAAAVERWLAADPRRRVFADTVRSLAAGPSVAGAPAAAVERFRARRKQIASQPVRPSTQGLHPSLWPRGVAGGSARSVARAWTFAGAGALALVGALAVRSVATRHHTTPLGAPMRVYATRPGQRATITLGDGSRVVLAVASTLRVPDGISSGARDVVLDGEAYFTVRHDATRPFRVRTRTAVTEDLGTEFAVRAYPEDSGVQVAVLSGSVAVGPGPTVANHGTAKRPRLVLTAGQLGRLDNAGGREERETVDVALYLAWTKGRLVFHDTPLREVARLLSRWYDLDVTVADTAIAERRLTASFTTEPVGQVLNFIAPAVDARLEQHGRSVQLYALRRSTP